MFLALQKAIALRGLDIWLGVKVACWNTFIAFWSIWFQAPQFHSLLQLPENTADGSNNWECATYVEVPI